MRKALILNSGRIYPKIHTSKGFLLTINNQTVLNYLSKNIDNELTLPPLTVCNVIHEWYPDASDEIFYTVLEADGEMCIMKSNNGFEYITGRLKLELLQEIFEYYNGR